MLSLDPKIISDDLHDLSNLRLNSVINILTGSNTGRAHKIRRETESR